MLGRSVGQGFKFKAIFNFVAEGSIIVLQTNSYLYVVFGKDSGKFIQKLYSFL